MSKARRKMSAVGPVAALAAALSISGCAGLGLGDIIQAPRFESAPGREPQMQLLFPSSSRPSGGATVTLWARVQNPNGFGLTLSRLAGNLFLEGARAAEVDFPLGLPLQAQGDTIVPIRLTIDFDDLPDLADLATRVFSSNRLSYRLDGTIGVDAGPLGQPSFGPRTWLDGEVRVVR